MSRIVEAAVPRRLGVPFRWLLGSSWVSNAGDGVSLAAGPLLVASQTHDPFLVALAPLLQQLPWLLFGLYAGALADRVDRKTIVIVVDLLRVVVLALLVLTVVTGTVGVPVVLATVFLLGTAETFADTTTSTLLPMVVDRDDLPTANARLMAGFITVNQLAGPPVGAALFAAGAAWPFVTQALLVATGVLLVSRVRTPPLVRETGSHVVADIAAGMRWVWHNPAVRTLTLTIVIFNVTFGAAWSVLVLYATQRVGLGEIGFGLLTTMGGLGGIAGTAAYGWLTARVSLGNIMRAGLIIETLTHLALALTRSGWVAMAIFFVFGAHAFVWGTTATSVRQRAVPGPLQGRVSGVYLVGVYGGLVAGSAIGGVVAQHFGVTAPFWFAFGGSALFLVLIWGQLRHIAHAEPRPTGPAPSAGPGPR